MSWVTDVIVLLNLEEQFDENYNILDSSPCIDEINAWLKSKELGSLKNLSSHMATGGKMCQSYVYGGSFNYLPIEEFKEFFFSRSWKEPGFVQLLLNDEEDMCFTLHQKNA